jgi:hypothetical protein
LDQIALFACIPEDRYQRLREVTRHRARLVRSQTQVKIGLRVLLARHNRMAPYRCPFGPRGLYWFSRQDFGPLGNVVRDEVLGRFAHHVSQIAAMDGYLETLRPEYPELEILCELTGIGLFSALMLIGEFGDAERFAKPSRRHFATELTVVAMDLAGSRHETPEAGCSLGELLSTHSETCGREESARGGSS